MVDDYTVIGFRYENPSSEVVWDITGWETKVPVIHHYWVAGKSFYSAAIHFTPINFVEGYHPPPITENIDVAERKAVLKAIAEWNVMKEPVD
jgi:hypothetical protein